MVLETYQDNRNRQEMASGVDKKAAVPKPRCILNVCFFYCKGRAAVAVLFVVFPLVMLADARRDLLQTICCLWRQGT